MAGSSTLYALIAFSLSVLPRYTALQFKTLGSFPVSHPAFAYVGVREGTDSNWTLLCSSFVAFGTDRLYYVRDLKQFLPDNVERIRPDVLTTHVTWPNEFRFVPGNVFSGHEDVASVASGFLVPFKRKGAVSLVDMSKTPPTGPYEITSSSEEWFYHRVVWHDMNGDGRVDALTARANKPLFGKTAAQLLWLEQPAANPFGVVWKEHILVTGGPDIFFLLVEDLAVIPNGGPVIISAEFFSQRLTVTMRKDATQAWSQENVESYTIDMLDAPFDLQLFDVNADDKVDLVVTVNSEYNGSLLVYEIPKPFNSSAGAWQKHVIAFGFQPLKKEVGKGAPGSVRLLCPNKNATVPTGHNCPGRQKPFLLLSGDDGGTLMLFSPKDSTAASWVYTKDTVLQVEGTIGQLAVVDIDSDGSAEVFVPDYNHALMHVFTTT